MAGCQVRTQVILPTPLGCGGNVGFADGNTETQREELSKAMPLASVSTTFHLGLASVFVRSSFFFPLHGGAFRERALVLESGSLDLNPSGHSPSV